MGTRTMLDTRRAVARIRALQLESGNQADQSEHFGANAETVTRDLRIMADDLGRLAEDVEFTLQTHEAASAVRKPAGIGIPGDSAKKFEMKMMIQPVTGKTDHERFVVAVTEGVAILNQFTANIREALRKSFPNANSSIPFYYPGTRRNVEELKADMRAMPTKETENQLYEQRELKATFGISPLRGLLNEWREEMLRDPLAIRTFAKQKMEFLDKSAAFTKEVAAAIVGLPGDFERGKEVYAKVVGKPADPYKFAADHNAPITVFAAWQLRAKKIGEAVIVLDERFATPNRTQICIVRSQSPDGTTDLYTGDTPMTMTYAEIAGFVEYPLIRPGMAPCRHYTAGNGVCIWCGCEAVQENTPVAMLPLNAVANAVGFGLTPAMIGEPSAYPYAAAQIEQTRMMGQRKPDLRDTEAGRLIQEHARKAKEKADAMTAKKFQDAGATPGEAEKMTAELNERVREQLFGVDPDPADIDKADRTPGQESAYQKRLGESVGRLSGVSWDSQPEAVPIADLLKLRKELDGKTVPMFPHLGVDPAPGPDATVKQLVTVDPAGETKLVTECSVYGHRYHAGKCSVCRESEPQSEPVTATCTRGRPHLYTGGASACLRCGKAKD